MRLGKQAGLDWNGANRKGWNGASLTSRSRGAEIFFSGWLWGWAGCGMEWHGMSGLKGEPGLLWAEQAGRLNETDEERRSVECRPAWADGEAQTDF